MAIGAGVGALGGFLIATLSGEEATEPGESTIGWSLFFAAVGARMGAAIGAVADAATEGKITVFRVQVTVAPTLAQRQKGLVVTWRF